MAESINYGGSISLDQLSEITRQQQQQQATQYVTKDGKPAPLVKTNDLTGVSDDPLGDLFKKLEGKQVSTPPVPGATLVNNIEDKIVYSPGNYSDMSQPIEQQKQPQYTATKDMRKLDPSEIAPPRIDESAKAAEEFRNKLITDLDKAIIRDRQDMWDNVVEPLYRQELEKKMLSEGEEISDSTSIDDSFDIDMSTDDDDDINFDDVGDFGMNDNVNVTLEMGSEPEQFSDNVIIPTTTNATPVQEITEQTEATIEVKKEAQISQYKQPEESKITVPMSSVSTVQPSVDIAVYEPTMDTYNSMTSSDLDDIFNGDDDDDSSIDTEAIQAAITEEVKSKVRPINNLINLSEYSVSTKAVTGSKVLSQITQMRNTQIGTWALVNAGRPITMTAMYGDEIERINPDPDSSALSEFQRQKQIFSIFYDHTVDANKPASLEAWTKTIPASDIQNLYFCAYRATFSNGANYLPRRCPNSGCNNGFLELVNLDSMVKYKDDEAKNRIQNILNMDPTSPDLGIKAALYQVSDELCISIRTPSIYSMIFEEAVLNKQFKTKYSELAGWISCIEDIYIINHSTKQLVKVTYKVEPNNMAKTTNNKYKTYAAILKTLSSDQYINAVNKINEIQVQHISDVTYSLPATKCPKCGTVIPEDKKVNAVVAFFMRHRLQTATHSSQE